MNSIYHWLLSLGSLDSTFRDLQNRSSERRLQVSYSWIPPSPVSEVCDQSAAGRS